MCSGSGSGSGSGFGGSGSGSSFGSGSVSSSCSGSPGAFSCSCLSDLSVKRWATKSARAVVAPDARATIAAGGGAPPGIGLLLLRSLRLPVLVLREPYSCFCSCAIALMSCRAFRFRVRKPVGRSSWRNGVSPS